MLVESILANIRTDILNNHYTKLPMHMVVFCRLISEVFKDIIDSDYVDMLTSFARDLDYDHEFVIWSLIRNIYSPFFSMRQAQSTATTPCCST